MKDKVYIKLKGLALEEQAADGSIKEEADNIEVINVGRYTKRGGKEYIKFEEVYDGADQKSVKNALLKWRRFQQKPAGLVLRSLCLPHFF